MSTINLAGGNTLLSTGAFPPVRAASTGSPLTPSTGGLLTVDGITLAVGDRVLVKDETSAVNNGIYSAQTGPWIRTSDAKSNTQFFPGMTVTVGPGGNVNAGQTFVCTCTDDPVVVGTSSITWASQAAVQTAQLTGTSTTSLTIGTGTQTLAIQSGKAFKAGQEVLIYETSNTANSMLGSVTSYTGTSLVVQVTNTAGSGTHADWTVVLYNSVAAAGITPPIGTGNMTGPGSSTDGHVVIFNGTSGLLTKDGGAPIGGANSITPAMFANAAVGFTLGMLNGKLVASVATNAMTIAVKTLAGTDPSSSDPVFFLTTDGAGGWTVTEQQSALSITVPAGATLATVNGQANRIWVGFFPNGGSPVLGVYNSLNSSGPSVVCWNEASATNATGISSGSTSAQLWYAASTLTSKNFRIIGYVESTQATAGQWASAVTAKLFGPGSKKPGDIVQDLFVFKNAAPTAASGTYVVLSGATVSITPSSAANVVQVRSSGPLQISASGDSAIALSRGNTNNTNIIAQNAFGASSAGSPYAPNYVEASDLPNTAGAQIYAVQAKSPSGVATVTYGSSAAFGTFGYSIGCREIQI